MSWLNQLRDLGTQIKAKAGEVLYSEGEKNDHFFVIVSGEVSLYSGQRKFFNISAGGFLGVESVRSELPYPVSALTEKETVVLKVPMNGVNTLISVDADFSAIVFSSLQKLTRALSSALESVNDAVPAQAKSIPIEKTPPTETKVQTGHTIPAVQAVAAPVAVTAPRVEKPLSSVLPDGYSKYNKTAPAEWSQMLVTKTQSCNACKKEFPDQVPLSYKLRTKEITHDMRTIYDGFEMLWYSVRICPHCNAAALTSNFPKLNARDLSKAERNNYKGTVPVFSGFSELREVDEVFEAYYLALKFNEVSSNDSLIDAQLWRRLMWLYGDMEDENMRETAARNTLEKYANAYETHQLSGAEEQQMNIILGDLYIMFKEKSKAYSHFMNVVKMGSTGNVSLYKHASDAIQDMRAMQ